MFSVLVWSAVKQSGLCESPCCRHHRRRQHQPCYPNGTSGRAALTLCSALVSTLHALESIAHQGHPLLSSKCLVVNLLIFVLYIFPLHYRLPARWPLRCLSSSGRYSTTLSRTYSSLPSVLICVIWLVSLHRGGTDVTNAAKAVLHLCLCFPLTSRANFNPPKDHSHQVLRCLLDKPFWPTQQIFWNHCFAAKNCGVLSLTTSRQASQVS